MESGGGFPAPGPGNFRRMGIALLASAVLLLLAGCAGQGSAAQKGANGTAPSQPGSFMVPDSSLNYTAHYVVNGNGEQSDKTVWRAGRLMRVDFTSSGTGVSLFFLEDRAYSCSMASGTERCFDITSSIGEAEAQEFLLPPDLTFARDAGPVDIGGTRGRCYTFPPTPTQTHEVCLTDTGVMAYNEYNMSSGEQVEYLSSLDYSAPDSAFVLPAQPQGVPAR